MTGLWLDLLGYGWELVVIGFILAVGIAIWVGPGDEYSGAPVDDDDEGEELPYDPDRERDWRIADEMEAL